MKKALMLIIFCLIPMLVFAAPGDTDKKLDEMYGYAEDALSKKDFTRADYWIARYLALTEASRDTLKGYDSLLPLFNRMQDRLKEISYIPGKYHASFINFFFSGPRTLWGVPGENITKDGMFAVRSNMDLTNTFAAMFLIAPRLKRWQYLPDKPLSVLVPMGDAGRGIIIQAGRVTAKGGIKFFKPYKIKPDKYQDIQWVWHTEFHNMDNDTVPEIWARYNIIENDGYTQRLDIFKIEHDSRIKLIRRFEGKGDGVARRISDNTVQTVCGIESSSTAGEPGFMKCRLETWKYDGKDFVRTGTTEMPHILIGKQWQKFYYQGDK